MTATSFATLWVFIALLVFIGILIWQKVPAMIAAALDARGEKIAGELDEARRLREEAQALLAAFQKKRVAAEKEAEDIVALAKEEAARLVREAEEGLATSIARKTKAVEAKVDAAMAAAEAEVRALAVDVALAAAREVLAARVKGDVAQALVSSGIAEVRAHLN